MKLTEKSKNILFYLFVFILLIVFSICILTSCNNIKYIGMTGKEISPDFKKRKEAKIWCEIIKYSEGNCNCKVKRK